MENKPTTQPVTHYKKLYNPDYLGSWDLMIGADDNEKPIYKEVEVTIESITIEDFTAAGKTEKGAKIIRFVGVKKPFKVNPTNAFLISKATGTPVKEFWIGKKITLFVTQVSSPQGLQDAIRVKKK
jgi:hypothetical protein